MMILRKKEPVLNKLSIICGLELRLGFGIAQTK